MTKKIFYEKIGDTYVPVKEYDPDFMSALPDGFHLLQVNVGLGDNGRSVIRNIDPEIAPILAAAKFAEREIINVLAEAQTVRPKDKPITAEQKELWEKLAASFKKQDYPIILPVAQEAATKATNALIDRANKFLNNPAIKKAYDQFLLLCELTKYD